MQTASPLAPGHDVARTCRPARRSVTRQYASDWKTPAYIQKTPLFHGHTVHLLRTQDLQARVSHSDFVSKFKRAGCADRRAIEDEGWINAEMGGQTGARRPSDVIGPQAAIQQRLEFAPLVRGEECA